MVSRKKAFTKMRVPPRRWKAQEQVRFYFLWSLSFRVCEGLSKFHELKSFLNHPTMRTRRKSYDPQPHNMYLSIGNSSPQFEFQKLAFVGYQFGRASFSSDCQFSKAKIRNSIFALLICKSNQCKKKDPLYLCHLIKDCRLHVQDPHQLKLLEVLWGFNRLSFPNNFTHSLPLNI